ncbi:MAG: pyridoxamine 5'-phosphate oxidase family protein [Deltaproteobacteria bacterium]|nr:pyridoxamine 5'-phosphate oxidase family protein [Deltaproteobacteria bacterium]
MKTTHQFRKQLTALFASQHLATLSTQHGGQPYASLVAFHAAEDLKRLFFVTPKTTRKFANLTANNRVAMLIDNSNNQAADFHEAVAVTAVGIAGEIVGIDKETTLKQYLAKHPHLEEFARAPTCALVGVSVRSYYLVRKFQNVSELHIEST